MGTSFAGLSLLVADREGRLYDVPGIEPAGMKAGHYFRLKRSDLVEIHPDSDLFLLPGRKPVGFDPRSGRFLTFDHNPVSAENEECFAVAAFLAPGYTVSFSASYALAYGSGKPAYLPLFSYAAVAFNKGRFFAAAVRVDREKRQEVSGMDLARLRKGVKEVTALFPKNRLVRHLERCALEYCCPAGRNFFLRRYEAPLPASPRCNAFCRGCISFQPGKSIPVTQPRISFVPSPEEISEVALYHMSGVKDPVVSFGQGCEGEPLMVGKVLMDAVGLIRKKTSKGIINLNTNASRPDIVERLFDRGLDSMRVSVNSVREEPYRGYYRPRGYSFYDVVSSIKAAKKASGFVSLNYLVMPGFTDSYAESGPLLRFLDRYGVDMIQWRNLNYDPLQYFKQLGERSSPRRMRGVSETIEMVKKEFPQIMHGYFNPSKGRMRRFSRKAGPE